jgi:hypothetical protein
MMKEAGVDLNNQRLVDGDKKLLTGMTIHLNLGATLQLMIIGMFREMTMETVIHLPDHKDHLTMTQEEEVEAEDVVEVLDHLKEVAEAAVDANASNAIKKDIWLENARTSKMIVEVTDLEEEVTEVVATELASNATRKVTWLENVLTQVLILEIEVEAVEEAEVMVALVEETEHVSNVDKKVTFQENVLILAMNLVIEELTRGRGEMMEVLKEGMVMTTEEEVTGIMAVETTIMVEAGTTVLLTILTKHGEVVLEDGTNLKQTTTSNKSQILGELLRPKLRKKNLVEDGTLEEATMKVALDGEQD